MQGFVAKVYDKCWKGVEGVSLHGRVVPFTVTYKFKTSLQTVHVEGKHSSQRQCVIVLALGSHMLCLAAAMSSNHAHPKYAYK